MTQARAHNENDAAVTLVTGAAGFLGGALTTALRGEPGKFGRVFATDTMPGKSVDLVGDITSPDHRKALFAAPVRRLFHLAGVVSGRAEQDFALGKRVNLDATIDLLERCREQHLAGGPLVTLVFASSIAAFGLPSPRMDDATPPAPVSSYGAHKYAIEGLIGDYHRRGFLDGRSLRLPGVVVRPPLPNGALSAFNSDIFREPLAGRTYACPLPRTATTWLTSRACAVRNLIVLSEVEARAIGVRRVVTAPVLAASLHEIAGALGTIDPAAPQRITFNDAPEPALSAQFGAWPRDAAFANAAALGLCTDASLEALIEAERGRGAI